MKKDSKKYRIKYSGIISAALIVYDIVAIFAAYFFALWIRFDARFSLIEDVYIEAYLKLMPFYVLISLVIFWNMKMYHSLWKYVSVKEAVRCVMGSAIASCILLLSIFIYRMPISFYIIGSIVQTILLVVARFAYRSVLFFIANIESSETVDSNLKHVMIIGAGDAGQMIIKDIIRSSQIHEKICCIIDDDPSKWNRFINGIPIVGGRDSIVPSAEKYSIDCIYITIPSASNETRKEILNICTHTNCKLKIMPGVYQFVNGDLNVSSMKDVSVEDLLGRSTINIDSDEINDFVRGKVILVTGGGGSIGSELCRQIAAGNPKKLVVFDIYENNAYDVRFDLQTNHPELDFDVIIGSVRDFRRLRQIFSTYRPQIVFHAAAHKHVPLMEDSPNEAIKNNVIGTYKTAYAAMVYGVERFVLISTDKAVNPTNIMGASKRLCEMVIQAFDKKIKDGRADEIPKLITHKNQDSIYSEELPENVKTEYVAVRFGNVLGSNGSVIPVFKRQIEAGGPVTVTHPDVIRYFMTIPEAVSLVLTAGTFAHGGEIFVLDMGSPMNIDTLARNLIRLSGYRPGIDIKIEYTGLRPGEKLFEEKLMSEEGLKRTKNDLIHIGTPIPFDIDEFNASMQMLCDAAYDNSPDIKSIVAKMVSTYRPAGEEEK